mgnify:CR=1 FL=1
MAKQPVVPARPASPLPTTEGPLDSIGSGISRTFQAAGMGMEVTHRTLWCVNRKVIEGQVTIALSSGNNIEQQKQNYAGGYDEATKIVDEILGM